MDQPTVKPDCPNFSSGPTTKFPGWSVDKLDLKSLGRSHRSSYAKGRLKYAIDLTREVLEVPDTHLIGIVPASDTGAVEMAMWSMLGPKPVTVMAWESFGSVWVTDAVKQLKIEPDARVGEYGELPDLNVPKGNDIVFTWNGTTSGARVPNADWIADDREGVTICDATSAAFAQQLPWDKLDVTTYSWQKVMGGEAQHGILILGPRAVERLESHTPDWPLPKLFRMTKGGKLNAAIFEGATINTPSLLATEDHIQALEWAKSIGGLEALIARADANAAAVDAWVQKTDWVDYLTQDASIRSNTSVCLKLVDPRFTALSDDDQKAFCKNMEKTLSALDVGHDFNGYRDAPAGLRIWCGGTLEASDIERLCPWLDWAFEKLIAEA